MPAAFTPEALKAQGDAAKAEAEAKLAEIAKQAEAKAKAKAEAKAKLEALQREQAEAAEAKTKADAEAMKAAEDAKVAAEAEAKAKLEALQAAKDAKAKEAAKAEAIPALQRNIFAAIKAHGLQLSALTRMTAGGLAALGGIIAKWSELKGYSKNSTAVEALETAAQLEKTALDLALVRRALKAHTARKEANKLGVYKAWSAADTDKVAQAILDAAKGVKRKPHVTPSALSRLLSAIKGVSEIADLEAAERELTARKAALEAAEAAALAEAAK
jgi:hypothetical protein